MRSQPDPVHVSPTPRRGPGHHPALTRSLAAALFLLWTTGAGCGDGVPGAGADADTNAGTDARADAAGGADGGTQDAASVDTPTPAVGGARAFVAVGPEDLIGGPTAAGVVGDVVLANPYVRFVVRNQERSLLLPSPGALVDADVVRGPGEPGQDRFFEVFPMTSIPRVFRAQGPDGSPAGAMTIVDDGAVSGRAVVRFTGTDGGMTLIDSILPSAWLGLDVTLEYVLEADARYLEIDTIIRNPDTAATSVATGSAVQLGDRLQPFFDGCGPDQECLKHSAGSSWLGGSAGGVSYALTLPAGETFSLLLARERLLLLSSGEHTLGPGQSVTLRQFLAVGAGSVDEVVETARALRGQEPGVAVPVHVSMAAADTGLGAGDALGSPAAGTVAVRLAAEGEAAGGAAPWVTRTRPAGAGDATVHLPPGTYDFVFALPGAAPVTASGVEVVAGAAPPTVPLAAVQPGRLHVHVTDSHTGAPQTAALVLQPGHDAPWLAGVARFEAIHQGDQTLAVSPGAYTATVSRGLTWTIDRQNVTVTTGGVWELDAHIQPAEDTSDGLMLNSHGHSERSLDSQLPVEDRVWNAVANGVEVMNATDHDFFGSHQATIEALGLERQVASTVGDEISPLWGHTTAAGCAHPPPYATYYAVDYTVYDEHGTAVRAMTPAEVYQEARERFGCALLAVNHPFVDQATFSTYHIDAQSDPAAALPDLDLSLVDGVEVYNEHDDQESIWDKNLPTWFNLLNRGYHLAALGGSDEHEYNGNYGNPRNWVPVPAPTLGPPGAADGLDEAALFDAVKGLRSLVLGGPMIRLEVTGDGAAGGLGDTVVATSGVVTVHVRVLAPAWMGLSFTRLYANGQVVQELAPIAGGDWAAAPTTPPPAEPTPALRLDETFELPLSEDAHLVVIAGSLDPAHEMAPVSKHLPLSVTNPIFVDVGGDGYTPVGATGGAGAAE